MRFESFSDNLLLFIFQKSKSVPSEESLSHASPDLSRFILADENQREASFSKSPALPPPTLVTSSNLGPESRRSFKSYDIRSVPGHWTVRPRQQQHSVELRRGRHVSFQPFSLSSRLGPAPSGDRGPVSLLQPSAPHAAVEI